MAQGRKDPFVHNQQKAIKSAPAPLPPIPPRTFRAEGDRAQLSSDALGPHFRTLLDMRTWPVIPSMQRTFRGAKDTLLEAWKMGRILLSRK